MKKRIVLAAITSVVALAGVPAASAAGVAPANGNDVILPNGDVYQLGDDGVYQLIPDVATGNAMKLDWNALMPVDELDAAVGAPIAAVADLANLRVAAAPAPSRVEVTPANGDDVILPDGDVYQLGEDGVYQLIPDVATGDAMNLDWNALTPVDELDADVGSAFPDVG